MRSWLMHSFYNLNFYRGYICALVLNSWMDRFLVKVYFFGN
jgi:hypothetical protein